MESGHDAVPHGNKTNNDADGFTKLLDLKKFEEFRNKNFFLNNE